VVHSVVALRNLKSILRNLKSILIMIAYNICSRKNRRHSESFVCVNSCLISILKRLNMCLVLTMWYLTSSLARGMGRVMRYPQSSMYWLSLHPVVYGRQQRPYQHHQSWYCHHGRVWWLFKQSANAQVCGL